MGVTRARRKNALLGSMIAPMNGKRHTAWLVSALALTFATGATPLSAQDSLEDIKRELAALRAEVQQLRAQVDTLQQSAGAAAPASVELLATQVAELAQTKVESTSRLPVKLFGTLHAHFFTNSANPNWLDLPNLVTPPPADGGGTTSGTLRQTRLGFTIDAPRIGSFRTSGVVAMDFFGGVPAFQTGQVMGLPRLLVAYARIEGDRTAIEVGQDAMILAPRDPTSMAGFAFPLLFRSGNLYLRVPQARVEQLLVPRLRVTAGITAPVAGDFTSTDYLFVPPALSGERSRRPAVQGRIAYVTTAVPDAPRLVDIGLSGHVGWERQGPDLARSWATAVDFAVRRDLIGVAGEVFTGDNTDAFGGALGLNARSAGGWGEVQLFPSNRVSLTTGFGVDEIRGSEQVALPRRRNRSAYGNIIVSLTPDVRASFEYRGLRTTASSGEYTNHHFSWVMAHTF
jgi:hypothetical protein